MDIFDQLAHELARHQPVITNDYIPDARVFFPTDVSIPENSTFDIDEFLAETLQENAVSLPKLQNSPVEEIQSQQQPNQTNHKQIPNNSNTNQSQTH